MFFARIYQSLDPICGLLAHPWTVLTGYGAGNIINANYGQGKLETYCAVALIYWVLVIFVEMVFHATQRMTDKGRRTT